MKLNLGCGNDIKEGYVNVDFRKLPGVNKVVDLSEFPWDFEDSTADQILMLDFLEHFPYAKTKTILLEAWRILKIGAELVVQVPDFTQCANALSMIPPYLCNRCETNEMKLGDSFCSNCNSTVEDIAYAGMKRLYGGQDYPGNFHLTSFTQRTLSQLLKSNGFSDINALEIEHQRRNWNFKLSATKTKDVW